MGRMPMFEPNSAPYNKLLEELVSLEHEQWIFWSKNLAEKEKLSPERLERWEKLWVPYSDLDDREKEVDREWARRVIATASVIDFPYSGCRLRNSELSDDGTCSNESCEHYRSCKWFLKNFGDGKK